MPEVIKLLSEQRPVGSKHSQVILGRPVCRQAFCRLLGVGHGRFQKLKRAGTSSQESIVDGRFVKKFMGCKISQNRIIVHEYLEELYQTISEPMPEASETATVKNLGFRRRRGKKPRIASHQSKMSKEDKKKFQTRFLPPGTFSEYLQLLQHRHPDKKISLKLFSSETSLKL